MAAGLLKEGEFNILILLIIKLKKKFKTTWQDTLAQRRK
jgi:hypothetical protein